MGEEEKMTSAMRRLYLDIIGSLGTLPPKQKGYIFGYPGKEYFGFVHYVAAYITLEFIKYSFDKSDPEYPLRHFLEEKTDDERMLQSRIMKYVLKYKKEEIERLGITLPEGHKYSQIEMDTIEKRLAGYRLTEMNFFEHQNIHDLEIVKSIVERRIMHAKKVPNAHFKEVFEQYDVFVSSLKSRAAKSDRDMVFASLALFTLEWHYPIEMLYQLSMMMEARNITEIDEKDLNLLCAPISVESMFGGWFTADSRMVKERIELFLSLFDDELDDSLKEETRSRIKEIFVLGVKYKEVITASEGGLYKDWFARESSVADWASFLRCYDIFSIWEKKEWTNRRIKNMRYLMGVLIPDRTD